MGVYGVIVHSLFYKEYKFSYAKTIAKMNKTLPSAYFFSRRNQQIMRHGLYQIMFLATYK